MPILTEIGTKFKLQGVNTMQKKDLVTNIISRIEEVMRIKYQPKTKEEFKQIAKMVLDSILPQLSKTA
jgi:preprotein translocase subunit Sss1